MDRTAINREADRLEEYVRQYENYLTVERRLSSQTVLTYLGESSKFIRYILEMNLSLSDLSSMDIIEYLIDRQLEGLDKRTVAKAISALRSFFQYFKF